MVFQVWPLSNEMREPIGSDVSQYRIIARLMTTTRCESRSSASVNALPLTRGTPIVLKNDGLTVRRSACGRLFGSSTTRPSI